MKHPLTAEELESLWLLLAEGIAAVGPEKESVFLAKLALLLIDRERLAELPRLIEIAKRDL